MDRHKLDQSIQELHVHKDTWARLPIPRKMDLLLQTRKRLGERGGAWVEASVRGKQMDTRSPWVGEEWTTGPWAVAAGINGYLETLGALSGGHLLKPKKIFTRPSGQVVAQVFPNNIFDTLMLNGISAEVWMQPGVTAANLADHMASFYKQKAPTGKVALVLGAGNVTSISPLDALYRLYACGHVVILKMSPINDYLGPILEDIFAPYVEAGFYALRMAEPKSGTPSSITMAWKKFTSPAAPARTTRSSLALARKALSAGGVMSLSSTSPSPANWAA